MTGVYFYDEENEYDEAVRELFSFGNMSHAGDFDSIQDVYMSLNSFGYDDEEISEMSLRKHGEVVEILQYNDQYTAFIGTKEQS